MPLPELLAPAGSPDAAYAALQYGADAVYLGLPRFSARAEAVNFTAADLALLTAHAHALAKPRKVYLALNTLVKDAEVPAVLRTLAEAVLSGVDAVIIQDLGLARLVQRAFPDLALHASTQLALHSLDSVLAARDLGFRRVTLARELTLAEIEKIRAGTDNEGVELEVFIHGALCYSYSGLCLFSSLAAGRSGNRGRCLYSCREGAALPDGTLRHPFSLKDLALGREALKLTRIGVASLKIEGRKKSPLYVAAVVDYYRRLLDGRLTPEDGAEAEARIKTIFARPWTTFFFAGTHNPDAADTLVVGHRGAPLGRVEKLVHTPAGPGIAFTPGRTVERHDGLQIDLPDSARPFGFGVDNLYLICNKRMKPVFAVPAGAEAAVTLPADSPAIPRGAGLCLSSSQEAKRSYPFKRPAAGSGALHKAVAVTASLEKLDAENARVGVKGILQLPAVMRCSLPSAPEAAFTAEVPAYPARDAAGAEAAARDAFSRMGGDGLALSGWSFNNPAGLFVRQADWNRLRREMAAGLRRKCDEAEELFRAEIEAAADKADMTDAEDMADSAVSAIPTAPPGWFLYVPSLNSIFGLTDTDWAICREVSISIPHAPDSSFTAGLERLLAVIPRERIRLAAPVIARDGLHGAFPEWLNRLARAGWKRWLVPSLGTWRLLRDVQEVNLVADWTLYAMNRHAAGALGKMGFSACTFSPEDDSANLRELIRAFPCSRIVAYGELPLFISASCARANLGSCPDGRACRGGGDEPLRLRLEKSGNIEIWPQRCGSVVTSTEAYSLAARLPALCEMGAANWVADLRWRPHGPGEIAKIWRALAAGAAPTGQEGNFSRGLQ